ncbi:MAG: GNAT family N-acetyltransferase [Roseburia sp.]|nr:GNAT family N-acetyltransferase [Roseburia sp.]
MKYNYCTKVRDNDTLRDSFNELTRQTFGFDFVGWYEAGQWGDFYIPHVLLDGEKVVSNVSVNIMQFDAQGEKKNYIQLGTVMTDNDYRGQGLNREIMERIMEEYKDKVDGIYLFGNDDVVNYYPKFGFKPAKEYEYYLQCENADKVEEYALEKVDMQDKEQAEKFYDFMRAYEVAPNQPNQNDAMYMSENVNLFQFWLGAGYGDSVYYLPEVNAYVILEVDGERVVICQIFGKEEVDTLRLAKTVNKDVTEVMLGYTPVHKEKYLVREHKEEDCTMFIMGEDLKRIEQDKMMFPLLSHA